MDPMFSLFIWILCVIATVWLAFWVKGKMGLPADVEPVRLAGDRHWWAFGLWLLKRKAPERITGPHSRCLAGWAITAPESLSPPGSQWD